MEIKSLVKKHVPLIKFLGPICGRANVINKNPTQHFFYDPMNILKFSAETKKNNFPHSINDFSTRNSVSYKFRYHQLKADEIECIESGGAEVNKIK